MSDHDLTPEQRAAKAIYDRMKEWSYPKSRFLEWDELGDSQREYSLLLARAALAASEQEPDYGGASDGSSQPAGVYARGRRVG